MKAILLPFEDFQGKGVLDFSSSPDSYNQLYHHNQRKLLSKKENSCFLVGNEPTSVLATRRSPNPPISSPTLSSSQGGGGTSTDTTAAAAAAISGGNPSGEKCSGQGQGQLGMEDWESVLSGSPSQEQSILKLIMGDIEDPSMGLNKMLQVGAGTGSQHHEMEFNAGFGVVDQAFGFEHMSSGNVGEHHPPPFPPHLHVSQPDFPLLNARLGSVFNPNPNPLFPGMFQPHQQHGASEGVEEKPQVMINQNQHQFGQNPAMFLPLTYAPLQEDHHLSPPAPKRNKYFALKNLMEDKQLDFNQPFLTVRRFPPSASTPETRNNRKPSNDIPRIPPLPAYKSELKSGPVRNPGAVPFVWEKSPGRPKDESRPQTLAMQQPPAAPKLPPGRMLDPKMVTLDKGPEAKTAGQHHTRKGLPSSQKIVSLDKNVTRKECSKEENRSFSSDSDDEAYVDAHETLSRSESFFNCSVSGVSGSDGPEMKQSVPFLSDPGARDFMMGRFLPAAKAMASETPHFSTRKPPVAREQPRQIRKVVTVQKHPLNQYRPNNIPHYAQSTGVEEKDEDEDDDYELSDSSLKICGLLPRLCLQNSFCLVNSVAGLRKPAHLSASSVRTTKLKSSCAASGNEAENENRSAECQRQLMHGTKTVGVHEGKNELRSECSKVVKKTEYQPLEDSHLHKRLQGIDNQCSHPGILKKREYASCPGETKNSGMTVVNPLAKDYSALLAKESNEREPGSASPAIENTLYVDSVNMVKPQIFNSDMKCMGDDRGRDVKIVVKNRETEDTAPLDSSLQDIKERSHLGSLESMDSFYSVSDKSFHNVETGVVDTSQQDHDIIREPFASMDTKKGRNRQVDLECPDKRKSGKMESYNDSALDSSRMTGRKEDDQQRNGLENQFCRKLNDQETSGDSYALLPPSLSLPKSPSESWLQRTLPTVSFRNSSSRASHGMRVHPGFHTSKTKSPAMDPKWETIVRSTNVQHGHFRFSEELLTPIPET